MEFKKNRVAALFVAAVLLVALFASATTMNWRNGSKTKPTWVDNNHGTTANAGTFIPNGMGTTTEGSPQAACPECGEFAGFDVPHYGGRFAPGGDPFSYSHAGLHAPFPNGSVDDAAFEGGDDKSNGSADIGQLASGGGMEDAPHKSWLNIHNSNPLAQNQVSSGRTSGRSSPGDAPAKGLHAGSEPPSANQSESYLTPVPEPETYAMLLAGLGLMGVVARRRKQQY
jgi:hypothetical protein